MPTAATVGHVDGNASQRTNRNEQQVPSIPFVRASFQHSQEMIAKTTVLTNVSQNVGVTEVAAYGYMRGILLHVSAVGANKGETTAVTFNEDGPWNILNDVQLAEPSGATIAQFNNGYQLMLSNKFGGYAGHNDPRHMLTTDDNGNFDFWLLIPVEISERDALGSLPNQNAASNFLVKYLINPSTSIYKDGPAGAGSVMPTVTITSKLLAWAQPLGSNPHGGINEINPPALGTTQYWSTQQHKIVQGQNKIRLTRVGNYLRNLIFIIEDGGSRVAGDADWPVADFKLSLDSTHIEESISKSEFNRRMFERYGYHGEVDTPNAPERGVYPYDFCHDFDGRVGYELRDGYLITNTSSRLEISGTFANEGTLRVLTNDITTAGNIFL